MITDKVGDSSAKPEVSKQSKEKRPKHKVSGYKSQSKRRSIAGCRLLLRTLCRYPAKMDTPIIRTAVKSLVKINYRSLTEISFCYYGLSLMRTLTQGPCSVLYKGNWLYYCIMYCLLQQSISPKSIDVVVQFYPSFTFYFPLFWGMGMYDNGFGIKKGTF